MLNPLQTPTTLSQYHWLFSDGESSATMQNNSDPVSLITPRVLTYGESPSWLNYSTGIDPDSTPLPNFTHGNNHPSSSQAEEFKSPSDYDFFEPLESSSEQTSLSNLDLSPNQEGLSDFPSQSTFSTYLPQYSLMGPLHAGQKRLRDLCGDEDYCLPKQPKQARFDDISSLQSDIQLPISPKMSTIFAPPFQNITKPCDEPNASTLWQNIQIENLKTRLAISEEQNAVTSSLLSDTKQSLLFLMNELRRVITVASHRDNPANLYTALSDTDYRVKSYFEMFPSPVLITPTDNFTLAHDSYESGCLFHPIDPVHPQPLTSPYLASATSEVNSRITSASYTAKSIKSPFRNSIYSSGVCPNSTDNLPNLFFSSMDYLPSSTLPPSYLKTLSRYPDDPFGRVVSQQKANNSQVGDSSNINQHSLDNSLLFSKMCAWSTIPPVGFSHGLE
ncbi:hypothetical protein O181_042299 [Austropuccinia psidii MF-1]|uniref:Uncharacterized protein n=1 Tax=Austropuccinia psidii MF-1 TaxID=1389203 RepID=A0A9Q3HHC6_9BASI|nr:hypothetical protein [Austropuccinia psidii MF-1]